MQHTWECSDRAGGLKSCPAVTACSAVAGLGGREAARLVADDWRALPDLEALGREVPVRACALAGQLQAA